ncbi:Histidine kinase-, DNA gyrase B-, and HSP90-like ATPase [compost metagenome]
MMFAIEDSGIGIEPDRLARLVSLLNAPDAPHRDRSPEESYGLRNVHRRLLLHYGADAGLKIESTPGVGTRISFILPVTEE